MNAPELVGASGFVKKDFPNLYLPDRLWQTVYHSNKKFSSIWLSIVFITIGFRTFLSSVATGSSPSMKNISKGDFMDMKIPLPDYPEQTQIVSFTETESAKIDSAISLQQTQIKKLKEYKAVLIDSAVTGKIKITINN